MSFSRRRLPHIHPPGKWLFVTWHLEGSMPPSQFPPPGKLSAGKAFVWMDRYLNSARTGPTYLLKPEIAEIVTQSLHHGVSLGHYELGAWVLMANHVHVLLLPMISPSRLLQSLKGYTARQANLILGRTGHKFWQAESYDHWVRDDMELGKITAYIVNNPIKAGIVRSADAYRWSSAYPKPSVETILDAADTECPRHAN
jgi:putative transposase